MLFIYVTFCRVSAKLVLGTLDIGWLRYTLHDSHGSKSNSGPKDNNCTNINYKSQVSELETRGQKWRTKF